MEPAKRYKLEGHPLRSDPSFASAFEGLQYSSYKEVPRDGNCFYRSFAVLQDGILGNRDARCKFLGLTQTLINAGVSPVVYETYIESIAEIPYSRTIDGITGDEWDLLVGYLRLAAGAYIKIHSEEFAGFIGEGNVADYVASNVDPMGQRAGEIEIIAICRVFSCQIHIVTIRKGGHDLIKYGEGPVNTILHTPDHFEPLYRDNVEGKPGNTTTVCHKRPSHSFTYQDGC